VSIPGPTERLSGARSRSTTDKEGAIKYALLIYVDEKELDALSEKEMQGLIEASLDYDDALRESGHYIVSDALQSVQTATTVRVRNGKTIVTDGPFAETKEQLGGLFLINARDLTEAIQLAAKFPPARLGSVEVRAVLELKRGATKHS
jgi:hypothetical protein